jgi:hypothetical protein
MRLYIVLLVLTFAAVTFAQRDDIIAVTTSRVEDNANSVKELIDSPPNEVVDRGRRTIRHIGYR